MILGPHKTYSDTRLDAFYCGKAYDQQVECREIARPGWLLKSVFLTITGKAYSSARIRAEDFPHELDIIANNEWLFGGTLAWLERLECLRSESYSRETERRRRRRVKPGQDLMAQWEVRLGDPEEICSGYFLGPMGSMLRVNFPGLPAMVFEPDSTNWCVELMVSRIITLPLSGEEMTYVSSRTAKRLHLQDPGAAGVPEGRSGVEHPEGGPDPDAEG